MAGTSESAPRRLVGLTYDAGEGLPRIVVKAVGAQADEVERQFVKSRGRHRVAQNPALTDALMRLPVDSDISPNTYELVAALLLHVFAVEAQQKNTENSLGPN